MDIKKLKSLIKRDENIKLDFKQKLELEFESGRKELAKDVSAIANSKGGRGYLIIGIEDKSKNIIGIENDEITEEKLQQIISSRCEPPIPISYDKVNYENKIIGVISIYDGGQKPYQMRENGCFYIRRGSTTDTMRKQEIISALSDNLSLNIETCPIISSDISSINNDIVDKYFKAKGILINNENRITLMQNSGIINYDKEDERYFVTLGGLLIFSNINKIYIPHNYIKIVNKIKLKSQNEIFIIEGDLVSMIAKAKELIFSLLPENYPCSAVFEGIKNAVLYRDYSICDKEIEIILDYNSVTVISPGALISNGRGDISTNHNYIKRNMWIYDKFVTLDLNYLKSGRGFSKMKKAFKNHGKVLFVNSFCDNCFKIIFPGVNNF